MNLTKSTRTSRPGSRWAAPCALLAGATLALAPVAGGSAHVAAAPEGGADRTQSVAGYTPGNKGDALNTQLRAQLQQALSATTPKAKRAAATTVYFSVEDAPTYASVIRQGAQVWNDSVSNVKLVENDANPSLTYREGDDSRGSYAYTDGRGSGYIFFDYTQMGQYDKLRVAAHETGHALGLPDNYSGPCSELMSGGGPGTSCTNAYPNATEKSQVNRIWASGFTSSPARLQPAA